MLAGEAKKISLFVAVGAASTLVNYCVFLLALDCLRLFYLAANWTGYAAGVVFGYSLNARFTFAGAGNPGRARFAAYLAVYLASLALSSLTLWILVALLGLPAKAANIAAIAQSTLTNYAGCRWIVFRKGD